ncbi:DoxX protein [bacterium A37T11]|nr:DoxX protein [bacterium A37T11]
MNRITTHTVRILIAAVFIASGLTKVVNTHDFVETAKQYAPDDLAKAAVILPPIEVLLGLSLLLGVALRSMLSSIILLTAFFTLVYSYGLFFKGITDCGCFGSVEWLKLAPWAVYLRNSLILVGALWLQRQYPVEESIIRSLQHSQQSLQIGLGMIGAAAFTIAGLSFDAPLMNIPDKIMKLKGQALDNTVFGDLGLSADSTYALFVFSPSCQHCWNVTANVLSWKQSGFVDQIVAVTALAYKAKAEEHYLPIFGRQFRLLFYMSDKEIQELTSGYPDVLLVVRNQVVAILRGEIPSGYTYKYFGKEKL